MKLIEQIKQIWAHEGFKRYLSNTSWLLFGRIFTLIVSFIVTVYVVRYLGPTNYGTLSYAVGFVGLFSFLANLGIDQVLYRELVKTPEKADELLGSSLGLKLGAGLLTYFITCIITLIIGDGFFISSLIWIIGLSFLLQPFQIINFYFQSRVEARKTILTQTAVIVLLSIAKLLIIYFNFGIYYFSAIFVLESLLYALFYVHAYQKTRKILKWQFNSDIAKTILKASWPFMLATAFTVIYTRIDQFMIKHFIDTTSVGIYDAAVRIAEAWYFVPGAVVTSIFPAIINAKNLGIERYHKRLFHFFTVMFWITLAIALPIYFFSDQIIALLYGSKYAGSEAVLRIYVLSGISYSLTIALSQYLTAEHHEKAVFLSSLFGMIVNIALNLIWIPKYGISGAAYATLVAYTLVLFSVLVSRNIRTSIFKILTSPFKKVDSSVV